jgi:hypothetical protein
MIVSDERVIRFVSDSLQVALYPPFTAIGIEENGTIVAGAVFNCFTGPSVEVTVAGQAWTRKFLAEVGEYVFRQIGCIRMTFTTEQETVARLAERLGGKREGEMRDFYGPGRNGLIIGILKSEYRFLR